MKVTVLMGGISREREISLKPAGLRTHMLVALASTLITILSLEAFPNADSARLASYLVAGIGFIGGGTIIQMKTKVIGLTTATSLLVTVAVGIATGSGFYVEALITALLTYVILRMGRVEKYVRQRI